jgi:3-phenylpropionate/trans-cinnamate dioxygenase ferredoxin reductase subunit
MPDRHVAFLLIGGGLAAASCACALREEGAEGEVLLVGREPDPPYNRPPCSKEYLQGRASRGDALYRPADFWASRDIEVLTKVSAMKLDLDARVAKLSDKQEVGFDRALLATGANVRRLRVDGAQLEGIHYLRTLGNADTIRADVVDAEHVVLIGGSYIACEVAASLTMLGKSCTLVMQEDVTLQRGFGAHAGRWFQERLSAHGIEVHGGEDLAGFEEGPEGRVGRVRCQSGLTLDADAVVMGTGAMPDVMLARAAKLELGETGGIKCSAALETSAPDVFAAGDVCEYDSVIHGRRLRVEHWDVALQQGRTAALNMLGRAQPHEAVPYFFSDLADWASLEYVGPAAHWDREVVRGSLDDGAFSVWYIQDGHVAGALSVGRAEDLPHASRLIATGAALPHGGDELADESTDLAEL